MIYSKFKNNKLVEYIRKFFSSYLLMAVIVAFAALSNMFGIEIYTYYFYLLIIITATLFCDDLLSCFPIACCGYMTFAKKNNPLSVEDKSAFWENSTSTNMLIIAILVCAFVIPRIIYDIKKHKDRRTKSKLFWGFLALGATYTLGGLFSPYYNLKTAVFGIAQILALSFSYFCFYFTVDWKKVKKSYFPVLFTMIGFLMCIEVLVMLIQGGFFDTSGEFLRTNLFTGWGHYNNVASICVLTIPAPFYFVIAKRNGWKYSIIPLLFLVTTIFTQSRNGMLSGTIVYMLCCLYALIMAKKREKKELIKIYASIIASVLFILIVFKNEINDMFFSVYEIGSNNNGRLDIYISGVEQFSNYPILGNGFYKCDAFRWGNIEIGSFLPARFHNTYIQIMSSCGTLGIFAYVIHRFQTLKLFIKHDDIQNRLIGFTLIGFTILCIFDCHFHNFGPGFLYSALLILAEKVYNTPKISVPKQSKTIKTMNCIRE